MSMIRTEQMIRVMDMVKGGIKVVLGTMVVTPFVLGIMFGNLDATTVTYSFLITVAWDMKLWIPLVAYGVYKLCQYTEVI